MGQSKSKSSRYESSEAMPPNASTASTTPTQKKPMVVAAIDFGTTYSRYAFQFMTHFKIDPTQIYMKLWNGPCSMNYKTPTQLLIEKNGQTFKAKAFGYDADTAYDNASDKERASLFLFKRFRMALDVKSGLDEYEPVDDILGKSLPAMTVFSLSIKWLKNDIEKQIHKQTGGHGFKPSEILWILTVPAIWNDAAKQFMRIAATKAGIPNDCLEIGLEPETASIFCRHLRPTNFVGGYANLSELKEGEQYMVLNAGGGTVDFTIHEVVNSRAVKEVSAASGGPWGGINVDNKFIAFLEEITGPCLLEEIRKEAYDGEVELLAGFELAKRKMSENQSNREGIHIPLQSFNKICQKSFNKYFAERLKESKFQKLVALKNDKLWISADLFKSFFTEAIYNITNHVKHLLKNSAVSNCKHILMVGGFSESIMLQEAVRNVCPGRTVIIPFDAGLTIVKGAVAFGHDPSLISRRISKYSYGTDTIEDFRAGEHSTRFLGFYCRDIFRPFVLAGETLRVGEPSKPIDVTPFIGFLRPRMTIKLYAMEGAVPKYVTDKGCSLVGEIVVPMGMLHSNKRVQVQLILGGIELKVQCKYMNTGEITYGSINFFE